MAAIMESPVAWTRKHTLMLLAIMLLALLMRGCMLGFPSGRFFDEIYYVPAAHNYLEGQPDANSVHPPLAKIQLAAAILLFDATQVWGWHNLPGEIGWRYLPMLAGVGVVGLSAWLGYILTRDRRIALLAALLVAVDHLSVSESRICTLDNIQAFWIMLGVNCAAERIFRKEEAKWLIFSGLAFGVATACKWNGIFAAAGATLALLGLVNARPQTAAPPAPQSEESAGLTPEIGVSAEQSETVPAQPAEATAPRPARVWAVLLSMALLIPAVYALSYLPYRSIHREKPLSKVVEEIQGQHLRMIRFRYDPKQFKHQYISHFYQWPFVVRPVWFHYKTLGQHCTGIVAFGLIPFWWLAIYLVLEALIGAWGQQKDPAGQFLVVTYLSQWLCWASSTTGGFFYYMLPVVPLMAVLVARQVLRWWESDRRWAVGYAVVLAGHVVLYFPFMVGLKVPYKYFQALFFYRGWY